MKKTDRVVGLGCPSEGGPLVWTLRGHQTWDPLGSSSPNEEKKKSRMLECVFTNIVLV
jgi:hypothetical protein